MSLIEILRVLPPMPLVPKKLENHEIARIKQFIRCISQKAYIGKVKSKKKAKVRCLQRSQYIKLIIQLFPDGVLYRIETSPLIYRAN